MKKVKCLFGLFVMLLVVMATKPSWVNAASEVEPNNSKATATNVPVNTWISGNGATSKSGDWYKFTVTESGYFSVMFEHGSLVNSTDWEMYIYDSDGNMLGADYRGEYYKIDSGSNFSTMNIAVGEGTYYIYLTLQWNTSDWDYRININFTQETGWETEYNDGREMADKINVNKAYKGALMVEYDNDWYVFTVSKAGYVYVDFQHEMCESDTSYWSVSLYDSKMNLLISDYVYGYENLSSNKLGIPEGTYYLQISKGKYTYSKRSYSLKVNYVVTDAWETESNGEWESADSIKINKTYNGVIDNEYDVDWYKFSASSSCDVAIIFTHPLANTTVNQWVVILYDESGTMQKLKLHSAGNESNKMSEYVTLTKGIYTVKVIPYDDYSAYFSIAPYSLTISEKHACTGNWVTTQEATCTTAGSKEKYCSICNKLMSTSSISAKGHSYAGWTVTKEATCTAEGTKIQKCSVCGYENSRQTIAKVAHTYSDWTVSKKATCTVEGSRYAKCKVCGDKKTEVIEKLAHNYGAWKTDVAATCHSTGVSVRSCSVCGDKQSSTISKLTHMYGAWNIVSAATCQKAGSEERHCSLCGGVESRSIDKLYHIYGNWQVNTAATCHQAGLQERFCTKCGNSETKTIAQLTHQYSDWKESTPATCHGEGKEEKICTLCGDIESRVVPALVHKYGEWEVVSGGKIIPPIVKEKTCEYCSDTEQIKDWSYAWVSAVAAVVLLGVFIGMLNFFKGMKKNNRKDDVLI